MSQATLGDAPYRNSDLFSGYYLDERVNDLEDWERDDEAEAAFEVLSELWELEKDLVGSYNEDELLDQWITEVCSVLGFDTISEGTLPDGGGYVDRLLYESDEKRREAAERKLQNDTGGMFAKAAALVEAKQWGHDFDQRFSEDRSYRDASHQIKYYLERTPPELKWGILTNGRKWRLYGTKDYETQTYYEVDLPELLESGDLEQFKYFYCFFRPGAFTEVAGTSFLETVWNESETAAQELGEDLQDNVFTALRVLGEGFVESNDLDIDPDDEAARDELKEQSLVLLYRLMFVLYAESRGLIDPDDPKRNAEYHENFSLDAKRSEILDDLEGEDLTDSETFHLEYSDYSTSIWNRLTRLFELVDEGEEDLDIPPYNGGLFDTDDHAFLDANEVSDPYIAEVIFRLSTTVNEEGEHVLADYADLDTRHLGTIYEGLLEHEFRIAPDEGMAAVSEDGGQVWKQGDEVSVADAVETVDSGGLYVVNDEGERKATGAYYTPDYVVTYIVEETVDPLVEEIDDDLKADGLTESDPEYFRRFYDRVTELKVLDPAMGSGHFLTKATGYLTEQVMAVVREQEIQSYDEQDIRREISKESIYGVDLNGMAVELAKLSMWLETLAADQPLAFLDHHLKAGNSLVGSDITEVLSDDTEGNDGQLTLTQAFARVRQDTLEHVMELMANLLAFDNETLEEIKSMEELYDEIRDDPLYQRLFELANVHTAQEFGVDVPEDAYERMAGAIEDEDDWAEIEETDWFINAQEVAEEQDFFHWELEYPEVFFGEDGERMESAGFDAVVGNPPYVSNWELTENHSISPRTYENMYPEPAVGHWDLYILFCYRATELTRYRGNHSFITPSSLKTEKYARALRNYFIENTHIVRLVDFGELEVFTGVDRQCVIYTVSKSTSDEETQIVGYSDLSYNQLFSLDQDTFTEYKHSAFRVNLSPEDLDLKNAIERISVSLGSICCVNPGVVAHSGSHSELDFDKEDVLHDSKEGDGFKPYLEGGDIQRYALEWKGRYIDYESKQSHFHRPKYPELFENPKVIFRRISGENNRLISCFDYDKYYTAQRAAHAVNWSPEMEEHRGPADYEATEDANEYDIRYLNAIANSALVGYYFSNFLATGSLQGSYTDVYPEDIRQLPVREISSDTLNSPQAEYDSNSEQVPTDEKGKYHSLIHLAGTIKSRKQSVGELNLSLRDHLGTYSDGPTLADVGLTQPPEGSADSILQESTEQKPNLRIGEVTVIREPGTTVEIRLTARYKPDDEDDYETDQWGYTETDPLPALRITDLTETEADLIKAFVPVAVDEAGGFAGFRETATKTNSLVDRLRKLTLPAVDEVREGLESYVDTKARAEELEEKIERTDELIDEIVYELYGLTDEEIEIIEEAVGEQ